MANTTWSTTDKTAGVTLSNTNHTATASANSNAVRATDQQIVGKFYWETTLTTASTLYGVGVTTSAVTLASLYATPSNSIIVYTTGTIWRDNVSTGMTLGSLGAGGIVLCHALDATNGLYWARSGAAGNWNGSATANPATGIGGISTFGPGFPLYPAACFGVAAATTANFGDSGFTGTAPAGFTSGFTAGAAPAVNLVTTQLGSEVWATGSPDMRVTQIGAEVFAAPNPDYQLTQLGLEVWAAGDPTYNLTQIGLEVWASVLNVTPGDGAASGSGTASGVGGWTIASIASASGAGAASADTGAIGGGVGSSDGIGDAAAVGSSTAESVGEADAVGVADGVAVAINSAVAASAGSGAASGVGRSTAAAVAVASGSGQSSADAQTLVSGSGFFHPVF